MSRLMGGREPTGEGRVESVIVARRWDGESGRTGASFRRKRPRNHSVNITVYVITDPTQGLLSRGSQVRILPGAPVSRQILRDCARLVTTPAVTSRRSNRSHRTDD